jgi:hypothetical protein
MGDGFEAGGHPKFVGFEICTAVCLNRELTGGDGGRFDLFEQGQAVVSALRVHKHGRLVDGSHERLPAQSGAAQEVAGLGGVFAGDDDVAAVHVPLQSRRWQEPEGVGEFALCVKNES